MLTPCQGSRAITRTISKKLNILYKLVKHLYLRIPQIMSEQNNIYSRQSFGALAVRLGKGSGGSKRVICHSTRDTRRKHRLHSNFTNLHFSLLATFEYGPVYKKRPYKTRPYTLVTKLYVGCRCVGEVMKVWLSSRMWRSVLMNS